MKKSKSLIALTFLIFTSFVANAQIQTGVYRTNSTNTDYHHLSRNNTIGAALYINQVSTSGPILRLSSGIFDANKNVKFTFENNGNLGIGTMTPAEKLDVIGNIKISKNVIIGEKKMQTPHCKYTLQMLLKI